MRDSKLSVIRAALRHAIWTSSVFCILSQAVLTVKATDSSLNGGDEVLLARASALQPEYAADLLFPALDSGRVPRVRAIRMLRELFRRSAQAVDAFPNLVVWRDDADQTDQVAKVFNDVAVDRNSIRIRILRRMALLDTAAASGLLYEYLKESPSVSAGCSEAVVPSPLIRDYRVLLDVFPGEVSNIVGAATTPQQVESLIGALASTSASHTTQVIAAMQQLVLVLRSCQACTERVLATLDIRNSFGLVLERELRHGEVTADFQRSVADAYVASVLRVLNGRRCGDSRTKDGSDILNRLLLPSVQSLAKAYSVRPIDTSRIAVRYASGAIGNRIPPIVDNAALDLHGVVTKVDEGGSQAARERLLKDLRVFSGSPLSGTVPGADFIMRVSRIAVLSEKIRDETCRRASVDELFAMLQQAGPKRRSPAAWLLAVRYALNLARSPNGELSRIVRKKWGEVPGDSELHVYYEMDGRFGLLTHYEENTGARVGALLARF